jgi:hypothetical protein
MRSRDDATFDQAERPCCDARALSELLLREPEALAPRTKSEWKVIGGV